MPPRRFMLDHPLAGDRPWWQLLSGSPSWAFDGEGGEGGEGGSGGSGGGGGGASGEAELGEAGKQALDDERRARRDADKARKDADARAEAAEKRAKELEDANASESEKALAKAREEAASEARKDEQGKAAERDAKNNRLRVEDRVRALAGTKLIDPDDAVRHLSLDEFTPDDNGVIDAKPIAAAIEKLLKDKPYLAATAGGGKGGGFDGGARTGSDGSAADRAQARLERLGIKKPQQQAS